MATRYIQLARFTVSEVLTVITVVCLFLGACSRQVFNTRSLLTDDSFAITILIMMIVVSLLNYTLITVLRRVVLRQIGSDKCLLVTPLDCRRVLVAAGLITAISHLIISVAPQSACYPVAGMLGAGIAYCGAMCIYGRNVMFGTSGMLINIYEYRAYSDVILEFVNRGKARFVVVFCRGTYASIIEQRVDEEQELVLRKEIEKTKPKPSNGAPSP